MWNKFKLQYSNIGWILFIVCNLANQSIWSKWDFSLGVMKTQIPATRTFTVKTTDLLVHMDHSVLIRRGSMFPSVTCALTWYLEFSFLSRTFVTPEEQGPAVLSCERLYSCTHKEPPPMIWINLFSSAAWFQRAGGVKRWLQHQTWPPETPA